MSVTLCRTPRAPNITERRAAPGLRRFSWFMSGLNAMAVIACAAWSPAGIS